MLQYALQEKLSVDFPSCDVVVHYRVGDFIKHGLLIHPQSVAEAVASLFPNKMLQIRVGIMDGGSLHLDGCAKERGTIEESGARIRLHLKTELRKQLPNAIVADCGGASVDSDFFICAMAPSLVTAGGSFAVCAAVASIGRVLTPACKSLIACQQDSIPPQTIRDGWSTYKYKNFSSNTEIDR